MVVRRRSVLVAACLFAVGGPARADYDTHPELAPEVRCAGLEDPDSPTGYTRDCQSLIWDLPPATRVGETAVATRDSVRGYPNGMTDRPPPLYTDGVHGYERPGPGRTPLCPLASDPTRGDPDRVPWWRPTGDTVTVEGPTGDEEAPVHEVACRRGSRVYYGPWQLGTEPTEYDRVVHRIVRFENAARIARDMAAAAEETRRLEMNTAAEVFVHEASHHVDCYLPQHACSDWSNPEHAASDQCSEFRGHYDGCPADDFSKPCEGEIDDVFRMTSARLGRYTMDVPDGRGFPAVENQMWSCGHHVVNELPDYDVGGRRDFRRQAGGAVGEIVIHFFSEPVGEVRAVSVTFDLLMSFVRTWVPPFTIGENGTVWYAPFDLALGMATIHAHERLAKSTMDILPANPIRTSGPPFCGGNSDGLPRAPYENYSYAEPNVCEYWKDEDGPIILRKGDAVWVRCVYNNGVTPEAIKHGLVAGSAVETLKDLGAPIPDYPAIGPASAWGDALAGSPVGRELLYGTSPPVAYRVSYKCASFSPAVPDPVSSEFCPPNPAVDADGDYIDGPYDAPEYCDGSCAPALLRFSDAAGDIMCVPIFMYWPLDRIVDENGQVREESVEDLMAGDADEVGTPVRLPKSPSDSGLCEDDAGDPGCDAGL